MASFLASQILHPKHSCCPRTGSLTSGPSAPEKQRVQRQCPLCHGVLGRELGEWHWNKIKYKEHWKDVLGLYFYSGSPFRNGKYCVESTCYGEGVEEDQHVCDPRSSFLCPWTCHDFHLLTWKKEYSMSKKGILSVEYDFWSPLLSIEVCPAPRLKHMLWQQCWLCHPDPGGGPQCQILSGLWCFVFSCELLGAEHPQKGHGCLSVLSSICILHVVLLTT